MVDTPISGLPAAGALTGTELTPIVQGGTTSKTTTADIAALSPSTPPGGAANQIQYNNAGVFGGFTLGGDATLVVGTGVLTIAANAVTTSKINNAAVTLAKIQNAAANSVLLGAGSAGVGLSYTEITLGTGLTMTGGVLSATGSGGITQLTGDVTAGPGSGSQAATIANNAVTTAKINNAAVTLAKIQNAGANSVLVGSDVAGVGLSYTELGIDGGLALVAGVLQVAALGITNGLIASNAVTTAKISAGNVATASIANSAVTYAKIQNVVGNSRLLGQVTGGNPPAEVAISSYFTLAGNTLDLQKNSSSFTPVLNFGGANVGITYSVQSGRSYRLGNFIHVDMSIVLTSKGSSVGSASITGIPVAPDASLDAYGDVRLTSAFNAALTTGQGLFRLNAGSTTGFLTKGSAGGSVVMDDTDFTNTSNFQISITYSA